MTSGGPVDTAFYNRTYSVAFGERSYFDCEALRLTTRLGQMMAWLMVQRAVHAGEIDINEARHVARRLGGREVCLDNDTEVIEGLAPRFRSLMERSLRLYQRIARLDERVARGGD